MIWPCVGFHRMLWYLEDSAMNCSDWKPTNLGVVRDLYPTLPNAAKIYVPLRHSNFNYVVYSKTKLTLLFLFRQREHGVRLNARSNVEPGGQKLATFVAHGDPVDTPHCGDQKKI